MFITFDKIDSDPEFSDKQSLKSSIDSANLWKISILFSNLRNCSSYRNSVPTPKSWSSDPARVPLLWMPSYLISTDDDWFTTFFGWEFSNIIFSLFSDFSDYSFLQHYFSFTFLEVTSMKHLLYFLPFVISSDLAYCYNGDSLNPKVLALISL